MIKVFDIFSNILEKDLSIEDTEKIFVGEKSSEQGLYKPTTIMPENASNNVIECRNMLLNDGKKVGYILRDDEVVAVIGYKENKSAE